MRRGLLAGLLALALLAVTAAGAQGDAPVSYGLTGGRVVSETGMTVRAQGSVVVSFHGDLASGCAAAGLCGLHGTLTFRPRRGALLIDDLMVKGRRLQRAMLVLLSSTSRTATGWASLAPPCADTRGDRSSFIELAVDGGTAAVALAGPRADGLSMFAGRCGGPLPADLAGALPAQDVAVAILRQGRRQIDLGGVHPFAAHGLAGTVSSTVALHLGAPQRNAQEPAPGPGARVRRLRLLSVHYSLVRLSGATRTTFYGRAAADACAPLGSCGSAGSLTVRPAPGPAGMTVFVEAPARRPLRDLRSALGLATGGRVAGLQVFGEASWLNDSGSVEQSLAAPGRPACHDAHPLRAGQLELGSVTGGGLRIAYGPAILAADSLRTRCPGPTTEELAAPSGLAFGALPRAALSRRVLSVRLDHGGHFSGDGYAGTTTADIAVTLRRVSVHSRIIREVIPAGF